jgi:hypothetical protein
MITKQYATLAKAVVDACLESIAHAQGTGRWTYSTIRDVDWLCSGRAVPWFEYLSLDLGTLRRRAEFRATVADALAALADPGLAASLLESYTASAHKVVAEWTGLSGLWAIARSARRRRAILEAIAECERKIAGYRCRDESEVALRDMALAELGTAARQRTHRELRLHAARAGRRFAAAVARRLGTELVKESRRRLRVCGRCAVE